VSALYGSSVYESVSALYVSSVYESVSALYGSSVYESVSALLCQGVKEPEQCIGPAEPWCVCSDPLLFIKLSVLLWVQGVFLHCLLHGRCSRHALTSGLTLQAMSWAAPSCSGQGPSSATGPALLR